MRPVTLALIRRAAAVVIGSIALLGIIAASAEAQALAASMPHVKGTRQLVLDVLEKILAEGPTGVQVLGQGSWLRAASADPKKPGYADPLLQGSSDHDLRVVMMGKAETPAEQEAMRLAWLDIRGKLVSGIDREFTANAKNLEPFLLKYGFTPEQAKAIAKKPLGEVIGAVKNSINLYPPNQIVGSIVDETGAIARFRQLGAVPSLGNLAPEGVWGPGKTATVQQLENFSRARLFYRDGDVVRAGFADLVHVAEGYGYYTREGATNMAYQWIGKALEAVEHRDDRLLAKYLERVANELGVVKAKGGLPKEFAFTTLADLDRYARMAATGKSAVAGDAQMKALLKELQLQTGLLYKLQRTGGEAEREVLVALLTQQSGRWSRLGGKLREVAPSLADWAHLSTFLDGTMLAVSAYLVPRTAANESIEAAYRQAGVDLSFMAGLGPGFAALMTNIILDDAKDFGYALAVKPQDWDDFLHGISSVKGFQGVTDAQGAERSIEGLAQEFTTTAEIENVVRLQAHNIAALNADADNAKRERVAQELVKKFTPVMLGKWRKQRSALMADALEAIPDVEQAARELPVRIDAAPSTLALTNGFVKVTLTPTVNRDASAKLTAAIAHYRDLGMRLGGGHRDRVAFTDTYRAIWQRDGSIYSDKTSARLVDALQPLPMSFTSGGTHTATLTLLVNVKLNSIGTDPADVMKAAPLFERQFEQAVTAELPVAAETKAAKVELLLVSVRIRLDPAASNFIPGGDVMLDQQFLPLAADGSFEYDGPHRKSDTLFSAIERKHATYHGKVDLVHWRATVTGSWTTVLTSGGLKNNKQDVGDVLNDDKGSFTVDIPLANDEQAPKPSDFKISGKVSINHYDMVAKKHESATVPIRTTSPRRITDDLSVVVFWRDPKYMDPAYAKDYEQSGLPPGAADLSRKQYRALTGKP